MCRLQFLLNSREHRLRRDVPHAVDSAVTGRPSIAGRARQVHVQNDIPFTVRASAVGIGRPEQRDRRRPNGDGDVHRPRVPGDDDIARFEHRSKLSKVRAAGYVDNRATYPLPLPKGKGVNLDGTYSIYIHELDDPF